LNKFKRGDISVEEESIQVRALAELIKAHCARNTRLLKRMVRWGMTYVPSRPISEKDMSNLTEGRYWVAAKLVNVSSDSTVKENNQKILDDIKGPYKEDKAGLFKQPARQKNEPGAQHKLFKDSNNCWKIEGLHDESRE